MLVQVKVDGSGNPTIHEWVRKCVSKNDYEMGCDEEGGDGTGSEKRCICDTNLCNGHMPDTSKTTVIETTETPATVVPGKLAWFMPSWQYTFLHN